MYLCVPGKGRGGWEGIIIYFIFNSVVIKVCYDVNSFSLIFFGSFLTSL